VHVLTVVSNKKGYQVPFPDKVMENHNPHHLPPKMDARNYSIKVPEYIFLKMNYLKMRIY